MERSVTVLRMDEPARFNPEQLERLCAELGEVQAESEVAEALRRIGSLLLRIDRMGTGGRWSELEALLRALAATSERIGMATLARVAGDVAHCGARGDAVALAATFSRLRRVGDRSILAAWDLEDLSG